MKGEKMKKVIAIFVAAMMLLALAACDKKAPEKKEITISAVSGIEITPKEPSEQGEQQGSSESTQSGGSTQSTQSGSSGESSSHELKEEDYVKETWDTEVSNDVETVMKAYDEYLRGTFFAEFDENKPSGEKFGETNSDSFLVTNFSSKKEVLDYITKYVDKSIIGDDIDSCFAEKGGKLYLISGKSKTALGNVISCDTLANGNTEVCVQETSFGNGMEHINILTISKEGKVISVIGEIAFG